MQLHDLTLADMKTLRARIELIHNLGQLAETNGQSPRFSMVPGKPVTITLPGIFSEADLTVAPWWKRDVIAKAWAGHGGWEFRDAQQPSPAPDMARAEPVTVIIPDAPVEVCPTCDIAGCHHLRPALHDPEPVAAAAPDPVAVEAEPVSIEPDPVAAEPQPVAPEAEPVEAEPVEAEPVAAEPQPVAIEAEPVAVEPEPVAVPDPQPEAAPDASRRPPPWSAEETETALGIAVAGTLAGRTGTAIAEAIAEKTGRPFYSIQQRMKREWRLEIDARVERERLRLRQQKSAPAPKPAPKPAPAEPDPRAQLGLELDALALHLNAHAGKDGWTIQQDWELFKLAQDDWRVPEIAADMGRKDQDVQRRFDLLTDRKGQKFPRAEVAARLTAMLPPEADV